MIADPTLAWPAHADRHVTTLRTCLGALLDALFEGRITHLRGGLSFKILVEYRQDDSRPSSLRHCGWFDIRGHASTLRIDMVPAHWPSGSPAPIRVDEPCGDAGRVLPTAESISWRVRRLLRALDGEGRSDTARSVRMAGLSHLVMRFLTESHDLTNMTPFMRLPNPWSMHPRVSALRRGSSRPIPYYGPPGLQRASMHPDLIGMAEGLPGPHGRIKVDQRNVCRIGSVLHFTISPDCHIDLKEPEAWQALDAMRAIASWTPADGLPALLPAPVRSSRTPRSRRRPRPNPEPTT